MIFWPYIVPTRASVGMLIERFDCSVTTSHVTICFLQLAPKTSTSSRLNDGQHRNRSFRGWNVTDSHTFVGTSFENIKQYRGFLKTCL